MVFQPLKTFFFNQAQEFHQHGIAKTYVAVGEKDVQADKILGFATLIASEIDIRGGYVVDTPEHANRYSSLPAIKLARLAVDSRYRGNHVGEKQSWISAWRWWRRMWRRMLAAAFW